MKMGGALWGVNKKILPIHWLNFKLAVHFCQQNLVDYSLPEWRDLHVTNVMKFLPYSTYFKFNHTTILTCVKI